MNEQNLRRGVRIALALFLVTLVSLLVPGCRITGGGTTEDVPPPVTTSPEAQDTRPVGRPGIINIETEQELRGTRTAGTGVVLTASGLVLTNNHVIRGATGIRGTDADSRRSYTAEVVGYDRAGDIAVIRLRGASRLRPAVFASASGVNVGDPVTAIGNAGGDGGRPRVVTGEVTALDQSVTARDDSSGTTERLTGLIETDAPIGPGDSGGPLLNAAGRVIGINTAASAGLSPGSSGREDHRGYAIPSDRALEIARQIQRGESSLNVHIGPTAMLGVTVRSNPGSRGAVVAEVVPDSPAAAAGIPTGASIVAVDGRGVDSPDDLTTLMLEHHPGDVVQVQWTTAQGAHMSAAVRLAEGPPQ
ncbi:MAG TPA: trypsin-like peptidase domain-containing protein [Spirillospora sp.]